ncbi:MAG: zinc metallopeptidase [Saprospiraceae bacterium]|nr:zinc metallopeptidase [Saprospiraceae bacterium]MBL0190818.1 zinc metallopeptidase [Saprospiraceae bacterium]
MIYMILTAVMSGIGMLVSARLKSKFNHYSQIPLSNGMTGGDVAKAMLRHYGIHDVQVVPVSGMLTDHYNPANKTVNLSEGVFASNSVAAAAVAAHECGHAVQHATSYAWLQMRSKIVPVVNIAAGMQQWLFMIALGAFGTSSNPTILLVTIAAFMVTLAFSLITLPVEFDASNRAMAYLDESGFARGAEQAGAKDALWWAAMTYVAAALAALVSVVFLVLKFLAASRD